MTDSEGLEFDESELEPEAMSQFDAFVECLASLPKNDVMMVNALRVRDMRVAYGLIMQSGMSVPSVKVVCKQSDLAPDMGYIDLEGVSVEFKDSAVFAHIASLASNTEVYPLAQNKVRLTFTFNQLMVPLG